MLKPNTTLRDAREELGYSQAKMAAELGVSRQTYAAIEDNPDRATVSQARLICAVLSRKYEAIFFGRDASLTSA
jgi:DNA-binding XRE family transcriptional regulator